MRFSLQEVKKSIQRRGGELAVSLHFLRPAEAEQQIARLIAYHEQALGQPQRDFSLDEARAMIGDYRLAHCLLATLSYWYQWNCRDWREALLERGADGLNELSSPVQLRLALYTFVNEQYAGFLTSARREEALARFASLYHMQGDDLKYLLRLDSEEEALLSRSTPQAPTPQEVATLYNQWTFEAALCNSSSVHFAIDCQAFLSTPASPDQAMSSPESGLGAVIKRLCSLARHLGVYYDLAYSSGETRLLHLTLYGPQDVTGAPQQYGLRLARLCRLLLGYGSRSDGARARTRGKKTLGTAVVEASATVHFLQRAYTFEMHDRLLALLPSQTHEADARPSQPQDDLYDSNVEQQFAEAFQGLARSRGVDGWLLEREPEPLLLSRSIFIPDFALTRGEKRVYVEVLGFWTPSYRERKLQKLQELQTAHTDLLLIIPQDAREAFAAVTASFPVVYYEQQITLSELLSVLRTHYDDFAERLAKIQVQAIRERIKCEGLLSEQNCYEALYCYRRSEIQQASQYVINEQIAFLPGLGFYDLAWMQQLQQQCRSWLEERVQPQRLSDLLTELRSAWPALQRCEDAALEVLLARWPEVQIHRASIFEAWVELSAQQGEGMLEGARRQERKDFVEENAKSPLKEKQGRGKKRIKNREERALQEDLWSV